MDDPGQTGAGISQRDRQAVGGTDGDPDSLAVSDDRVGLDLDPVIDDRGVHNSSTVDLNALTDRNPEIGLHRQPAR